MSGQQGKSSVGRLNLACPAGQDERRR